MRKALFLCPSPFEVGTYFRAHAFGRYLVQQGLYEVDLICTSRVPRENTQIDTLEGVSVIQTPVSGLNLTPMRGWNVGEFSRRLSYLKKSRKKYDLIYSFEYQPSVSAIAFPLARSMGARHFNDWCDWYAGRHHRLGGLRVLHAIDKWMEEFPRRHVECVTTICQSLYDRALESGVPSDRLMVIREGADQPQALVSREEARHRLGVAPDEFLVTAIFDQEMKVMEDGIEQLARLRPETRLTLIGKIPKEVTTTSSHILTPGRISDEELHLWLCAADCAWLPLEDNLINQGRLPHKIGHFRMYGLPLVTTRVSDVVHIPDPGILYAGFNGQSFAEVSATLSALKDDERQRSMKHGQEFFGWEKLLRPLAERLERT